MKNKKALFLLFTANAVSSFAQGISMMAIQWYFAQTEQMTMFNLAYAGVTVASLFWGLYAGTIIDGFNRKDVFLGTNFIEGMVMLSIASLGFKEISESALNIHPLPMELIIVVFAMTFMGYTIHYPNLYAFSQEVTDPKDYMRVTTLIEIIAQTTLITSAGLGAFLLKEIDATIHPLAWMGVDWAIHIQKEGWLIHEVFLLDGIAYMVSFILIAFIKVSESEKKTDANVHHEEVGEGLKHGLDYLRRNPLITVFGVCAYSIFVVVTVEMFSVIQMYVYNHLGQQNDPDVLGYAKVIGGVGSAISGFMIGKIFKRLTIPMSVIVLIMLTTAAYFVCSLTQDVWIYYLISMIIGFTNSSSRIFRVTYLFSLIPNELMGRVNGIFNVITTVFRVAFLLVLSAQFFNQDSNIVYFYVVMGCYTLASGLLLLMLYKPILKLTQGVSQNRH